MSRRQRIVPTRFSHRHDGVEQALAKGRTIVEVVEVPCPFCGEDVKMPVTEPTPQEIAAARRRRQPPIITLRGDRKRGPAFYAAMPNGLRALVQDRATPPPSPSTQEETS